jgi:hypothetical protein
VARADAAVAQPAVADEGGQARVPRRALSLDAAGGPPLRLIPARTAALQLLARYLRIVVSGPVPSSAQLTDAVVTHLHELMALSLSAAEPGVRPPPAPSARSPTTPASATCPTSTGHSAAGTASRRPMPAGNHPADHLGATWLTSITTRSGPVRVTT